MEKSWLKIKHFFVSLSGQNKLSFKIDPVVFWKRLIMFFSFFFIVVFILHLALWWYFHQPEENNDNKGNSIQVKILDEIQLSSASIHIKTKKDNFSRYFNSKPISVDPSI